MNYWDYKCQSNTGVFGRKSEQVKDISSILLYTDKLYGAWKSFHHRCTEYTRAITLNAQQTLRICYHHAKVGWCKVNFTKLTREAKARFFNTYFAFRFLILRNYTLPKRCDHKCKFSSDYYYYHCVVPQRNYLYVHCAVSVIGLTAVDSEHK
jgi:hypothetical protein